MQLVSCKLNKYIVSLQMTLVMKIINHAQMERGYVIPSGTPNLKI